MTDTTPVPNVDQSHAAPAAHSYPAAAPGYQHTPYQIAGPVGQNGRGLAALILGVSSIALFWVPFLYLITALPAGIIAIVLGTKGRRLADQRLASNRGQASAGLVTGIVGTSLCGLSMVFGAIIGAVTYGA